MKNKENARVKGTLGMLVGLLLFLPAHAAEDVPGFVDNMIGLQYFMHKAGLSMRADNLELADFYLHEIEEILEVVGEIESYDEMPVGELSKAMLGPAFHDLEEAVDSGDSSAALSAYTTVINSCNACHTATGFAYIKIADRSTENVFMQDFSK